MTEEQKEKRLEEIIEFLEQDFPMDGEFLSNQEFRGMQVLAKYTEDLEMAAEHDQIYASSFEDTALKMSKEDLILMAKLGWFEEDGYWTHFV